jgi:hypothetical protein
MLRTLAILCISAAAAIGIAAAIWTASRGHVVFFPLVLLFGVPFIPLLGRRRSG